MYLLWRIGEVALNAFVYENADFAIQQIDVQTDGVIAPDQLRRWTGVKPGANLIALDLAAVKRNLELVSAIDSVSVERVLPRTLKIRVTERDPIAQVNVPRADASERHRRFRFSTGRRRHGDAAAGSAPLHGAAGADESATAGDRGRECFSVAAGPARRTAAGAGGAAVDRGL